MHTREEKVSQMKWSFRLGALFVALVIFSLIVGGHSAFAFWLWFPLLGAGIALLVNALVMKRTSLERSLMEDNLWSSLLAFFAVLLTALLTQWKHDATWQVIVSWTALAVFAGSLVRDLLKAKHQRNGPQQ